MFNGKFALTFLICDKRISGLYITLLATLSNLSYSFHSFYIFYIVDYLGIFLTQAITGALVLIYVISVRKTIESYDSMPKENWWVSDKVLQKVKHQ